MGAIKKSFPFLLILILAAPNLTILQAAYGQTSEPAVPEFTVKYVNLSYYVPPTYGVDQYTGNTIVTQDGYNIDNRSLQFTIKNQPFTPYTDSNGNQANLYYNFRIKGAYGTDWDYTPFALNGVTTSRYGGMFGGNSTESPADLGQSHSGYTTITIQIPGVYRVPAGAKLEVQAQAIVGSMEPSDYMMAGHVYVFAGQYSEWSNTQTVIVTDGESTTQIQPTQTTPTTNTTIPPISEPSSTSTPMPQAPNKNTNPTTVPLATFVAVTATLSLIIIAMSLLYHRKHRNTQNPPPPLSN